LLVRGDISFLLSLPGRIDVNVGHCEKLRLLIAHRPPNAIAPATKISGSVIKKATSRLAKARQYAHSRLPKLDAGFEYDESHCHDDKDQQDLLPQRPTVPRHLEYSGYLVDRPRPDDLDKSEDRSDALLQELQQLIEKLLHMRSLHAREEFSEPWSPQITERP
jgi:hypothetical protein